MTVARDGSDSVRDALVSRIDAMGQHAGRLTINDMASELEEVRRVATRHGIAPAVTVVHALDSALARGEHGPLILGWLEILRDAVRCGVTDPAACEAFAAACAVRQAR